ncbi:leucine repeat adapter protein 25-like [Betta splendens]|uniref:Leucine repeat adapter protein 25-like n=1 Tax=Betta splendens TaxID=158456 RepID=A0A6P7PVQ1_BETSP|nr:leucine repeat adapter protein 25-like [Betta splendens]
MSLVPSGAADSPGLGVLSAEGLPPLPRSLSRVLSSGGEPRRDTGDGARSRSDADATHAPSQLGGLGAGLGAALALLRKEMVDLRQLDVTLLGQMWSLHEDIQEYKNSSLLSDAAYSEEEEEEEDEKGVIAHGPLSSSLSLPPPSSNCSDQWIKDSFNAP